MIDFGIGMPNPELLPVELLRTAAAKGIAGQYLNYTEAQGDHGFRQTLAADLSQKLGIAVLAEELLITGGALQTIHHICSNFTQPGDVVFVEEPTFYLALKLFRDHGLQIISVPVDGEGLQVDRVEALLTEFKPKLLYTIPVFHNPTAVSLSLSRKVRLVELAERHDFFIIADEVYQLLSYGSPPPASFAKFVASEKVFAVGSFSKIVAPGLRLGWVNCSAGLMAKMIEKGLMSTSGGFNLFASGIVHQLWLSGQHQVILNSLRQAFSRRVEVMDRALRAAMPAEVTFQKPAGGYFFWLQLPPAVEAGELKSFAADFAVSYQPGSNISNEGSMSNFARLSFGYFDETAIEQGVRRLATALEQFTT